uniref:Microtubule-associated tumor suppressor 1 n=1 Tax=Echinostoma caproni TaxID=27848 RepID=A0A183ARB1_9TREM
LASDSDLSPSKSVVAHRIIQRNLDLTPPKANQSTRSTLVRRPISSGNAPPASNLNRQPIRTVVVPDTSLTSMKRAQKRPAGDSVFSRLSSVSVSQRSGPPGDSLGYQGVLKRPRVTASVSSSAPAKARRPIQFPQPQKPIPLKNRLQANPLTYSEGVLGTAIKPIYWSESSVKNRLAVDPPRFCRKKTLALGVTLKSKLRMGFVTLCP